MTILNVMNKTHFIGRVRKFRLICHHCYINSHTVFINLNLLFNISLTRFVRSLFVTKLIHCCRIITYSMPPLIYTCLDVCPSLCVCCSWHIYCLSYDSMWNCMISYWENNVINLLLNNTQSCKYLYITVTPRIKSSKYNLHFNSYSVIGGNISIFLTPKDLNAGDLL